MHIVNRRSRGKPLSGALNVAVLRTSRFFPEDDDTHRDIDASNLKANEFLYRRLTVEDAARAHVAALDRVRGLGFGVFVTSAPSPFERGDAEALRRDAGAVVSRYFPEAAELYARRGWRLPQSIGRVYDASLAESVSGFRCDTDFASILDALRDDAPLPFVHDSGYVPPSRPRRGRRSRCTRTDGSIGRGMSLVSSRSDRRGTVRTLFREPDRTVQTDDRTPL